jgi:hypothetical protein
MRKTIKTIYRNGRIELPPEIQLPENAQVTIILPDSPAGETALDPAYEIPGLAADIGPEDLARNLKHYLYGHPKRI